MTTTYKPISCDCQIIVESGRFLNRCNLHRIESLSEVKAHNLNWTSDYEENPTRALNRRKDIREGRVKPARIEAIEKPSRWARLKAYLHSG